MNCDCGKPSRVTSRGKSQCWDCFDYSRHLPTGVSKVSGHPNIPKSILDDPHWDGTWPDDGFDYSNAQRAIDTRDRADDDYVDGVCLTAVRRHLESLKSAGEIVDFKIDDDGNIYLTPVRPKTIHINFAVNP